MCSVDICIIVLCIAFIVFIIIGMHLDIDNWPCLVCIMISVLSFNLAIYMIYNRDLLIVRNASSVLEQRANVYNCNSRSKLECEYFIKEWQHDSIDWSNRVREIMTK